MRRLLSYFVCLSLLVQLASLPAMASSTDHKVMLRDIADVEGVRDNQLVGYGLVVGLHLTGDTQQTFFTVQTLPMR